MKTTIFANRRFTFSATLVIAALALSLAQSVLSQSLITDNFQSCKDDASLLATWTRVSGTDASIFLAADRINPANQTIQQTTAAGRLRQVFPGVIPTASAPLSLSFDLYDANGGTTSGRVFGEVRNSAAAAGLFAAGIYNSATVGYDMTRYQARNVDNGGWIELNTPRSVGWHNFRLEIGNNTASLYIDNVVDPQFNGISYSGATSLTTGSTSAAH